MVTALLSLGLFVPIDISQIKPQLKYVTNAAGEQTEVIVSVEIWDAVIRLLPDPESGLSLLDEYECKDFIFSDLKDASRQVFVGKS